VTTVPVCGARRHVTNVNPDILTLGKATEHGSVEDSTIRRLIAANFLPATQISTARRAARDSNPTTWFEVTATNSTIQLEQSLATLAAFANPT
jgi:hypothetical protein